MSDFFFFQAQLYVDVYYHAKKSRKNPKTKIYIGIEITQKQRVGKKRHISKNLRLKHNKGNFFSSLLASKWA